MGHGLDDDIARGMSEGVVHRLELVQIAVNDGKGLVRQGFDRGFQDTVELQAVSEPR